MNFSHMAQEEMLDFINGAIIEFNKAKPKKRGKYEINMKIEAFLKTTITGGGQVQQSGCQLGVYKDDGFNQCREQNI